MASTLWCARGFLIFFWFKSLLWDVLPHRRAKRCRASFSFGSTPQLVETWRQAKGSHFIAAVNRQLA
jgi:hypothetical protein